MPVPPPLTARSTLLGGIDTRPDLAGPNTLADAINWRRDRVSGLATRRGGNLGRALQVGKLLTSMFAASALPAGAAKQLIATDGQTFYRWDPTLGGALTSLGAPPGSVVGSYYEFVQAPALAGQGPVYAMNGAIAEFYGGAALGVWTAGSGTLPIGFYLLYRGNRVWVFRVTTAITPDPGNTYAWSELGDPRTWPAANVNELLPGDGNFITGAGGFQETILAFKPFQTHLIYDLDTGAVRQLSGEIGCLAHRTIVETDRGTYWLTPDRGLAMWDGAKIRLIPDSLNLAGIVRNTYTVGGGAEKAQAAFWNDSYFLTFDDTSIGAGASFIAEYDTITGSWWKHNCGTSSFTPASQQRIGRFAVSDIDGTPSLFALQHLVGGNTQLERKFADLTPFVDVPVSGGPQAVQATLTTHNTTFGVDVRKRFRRCHLEGTVKADVSMLIDGVAAAGVGHVDLNGADLTGTLLPLSGVGREARLKVTTTDDPVNDVPTRAALIEAITVHAQLRGR